MAGVKHRRGECNHRHIVTYNCCRPILIICFLSLHVDLPLMFSSHHHVAHTMTSFLTLSSCWGLDQ